MLIPFNFLIFYPKKIRGIIHIGAHALEELPLYLSKNLRRIIWIEANPEKYDFIEKRISKYKEMHLGKFAAGFTEKKSELNIASNGQSSSLLDLGTHKYDYPTIKYIQSKEVNVKPLDLWIEENFMERRFFNFINIDIQGYELEALKGMDKQFEFLDYIYLEVNFREVYKNCSQLKDIDKFLNKYHFYRVGMYRTNKGWGDAVYVKQAIQICRIYYSILIPFWKIINFPYKLVMKIKIIFRNTYKKIHEKK